ncbi:MAG: hypothetical protein COT74_11325 [Bdellovibrionales bacterium CG10_big_fil_rev_8_21_14_0_10_45_34]|nr:MAG: hypothetical protein COT74_11325 [Bdellovibrionales bacterium CG10_big_fil_rev_8_21_14_0_10_45_34]
MSKRPSGEKITALKALLESESKRFAAINQVSNDAIAPALDFKRPQDREIAAFICSSFAYGNVKQIQRSVRSILSNFSEPARELALMSNRDIREVSRGWKHRFNDEKDLFVLLSGLGDLCRSSGKGALPIYSLVNPGLSTTASSWAEDLSIYFENKAVFLEKSERLALDWRSFRFMLPKPSRGSTCKRLYLFFRWCVGDTENDLNLWGTQHKRSLIMPIDTHTFEFARRFLLTKRKTPNHATAIEVTEFFKKLDPDDPIRFDFVVCHLGIRGEMPNGWKDLKDPDSRLSTKKAIKGRGRSNFLRTDLEK